MSVAESPAPIALRFEFNERQMDVWKGPLCEELLAADAGRTRPPDRLQALFELSVLPFGTVVLDGQMRHAGLNIERTPRHVRNDPHGDVVALSLVIQGRSRVKTAHGERITAAGDVALFTSSEAFHKEMSADYREFFLYVPLDYLRAIGGADLGGTAPGVAPRSGLGRVLAGGMAAAAAMRAELKLEDWPPVLRSLLDLAAGAFARAPSELPNARAAAREVQHARAVRYIEAHLADPALTPPVVAAALGMSLRYLHILFEGKGRTVAATILALRLDRCRVALGDPTQRGRNVSEIAFAWGFNDAAHFSRAFKARFGLSPRSAR